MNEDEAILNMVDSNLHREKISFSEKAFAYKMKNDVLKRKSGRKKGQIEPQNEKEIMSEMKKGEITRVAFTNEQLHKYFQADIHPHDETRNKCY